MQPPQRDTKQKVYTNGRYEKDKEYYSLALNGATTKASNEVLIAL